jgi:hypothetical protein
MLCRVPFNYLHKKAGKDAAFRPSEINDQSLRPRRFSTGRFCHSDPNHGCSSNRIRSGGERRSALVIVQTIQEGLSPNDIGPTMSRQHAVGL